MHIAMIFDDERLLHERIMLSRLCVGLIDEGCTLTRLVPHQPDAPPDEPGHSDLGLAARISAPRKVLPWMRRARAVHIAQAMQKSLPDVLYAIGQDAWQTAFDLARVIERPVAINIWCAALLRRLPRGRSAQSVNAFIAPTQPLVEALRELVDPELVSYVPQGVAVPPEPWAVFGDPNHTVTIAIVGSGNDLVSYRTLLGALSRALSEKSNIHVFLELRGPHQHEIWRHAQRLDLLAHVSAITDAAMFRTLLTQCDMLVVPERLGELRSLLLEAMAMGIPIVAARDPVVDIFIPGQTAVVIDEPEPEQWYRGIDSLLSSPETARQLGLSARQYVQQGHRSSDQVAALLETLGQILHGGTMDFAAGTQ